MAGRDEASQMASHEKRAIQRGMAAEKNPFLAAWQLGVDA